MRDRPATGRDPVAALAEEIADLFAADGYRFAEGPELEAEWFTFDALNMDADHPSRTPRKAFLIDGPGRRSGLVLRGHTSPVQVREMLSRPAPLRMVTVGRVFRPDPPDATHSPVFHQAEGLAVAEGLTMDDLRVTLGRFAAAMFGPRTPVRLRPHWFAYTDPSAEVDVRCPACRGGDCDLCDDGWVEWAGCGMVHPRVLTTCGVDAARYSGFAFGAGVERTLMLRHGLSDIRDIGEPGRGPVVRPPGVRSHPAPYESVPVLDLHASPFARRQATARALAATGWTELRTGPFLDPVVWDAFGLARDDPRRAPLRVANPLGGWPSALRASLLPGVLGALRTRLRGSPGKEMLFEQGTVFLRPPGGLRPMGPVPLIGRRPRPQQLAALHSAVPCQPHHLAAAFAGARDWQATIAAVHTVGRQWGAVIRAEPSDSPGAWPWRRGRWVRLACGQTPVGEAGELDPAVLRRLHLPGGVAALTIELDAFDRADLNRLDSGERTPPA
jgi:phenylalanyl-tRNA synthetase alpha chain